MSCSHECIQIALPAQHRHLPCNDGLVISLLQAFKAQVTAVLRSYREKLTERTETHMGYPYNLDFDYGALEGLERFSINNLGDPFIESNYGVHSREFEVMPLITHSQLCVSHSPHKPAYTRGSTFLLLSFRICSQYY